MPSFISRHCGVVDSINFRFHARCHSLMAFFADDGRLMLVFLAYDP
jgi:hypothetical protein